LHNFTLPEDRCVRLLVKKLGRGIPESVVREKLEYQNIRIQGVTQLRSGGRGQDPAKDRPPTPQIIISVARGPQISKVGSLTELSALRVSVKSYVAPQGPLQCKHCQRFRHTQRNFGFAYRRVAYGGSHLSGGCSTQRDQPQCCGCGGDLTENYRGCIKWKEAQAALAKQAPEHGRKSAAGHPAARKLRGPRLLLSSWTWARVESRRPWGRVVKVTTTPPQILNSLLSQSRRRLCSLK
jgi:hypothetical protein